MMKRSGKLVDIHKRRIYPAEIIFTGGLINEIREIESSPDVFMMPGLIDAHIHIESSMATPGAFASAAVSRGTTAVVSDPHEIANILGMDGVRFMMEDAKKVPLKFWFGAPSCVPATKFESAGASLDRLDIEELLKKSEIKYLGEMMNFPGVIYDDKEVVAKIRIAKEQGKPIDGHAPGLTGMDLKKYVSAGISTDHECSSIAEALEKIGLGMKILIREGSAARNLDALKSLLSTNSSMVMLCSDDMHPEMLIDRHLDKIVSRLVTEGYDLFDVLRSCTINPSEHYRLGSGLLLPGQPADFIIVDDFRNMQVLETWINGEKVYSKGEVLFSYNGSNPVNKFHCTEISANDIMVVKNGNNMRILEAFDGELITKEIIMKAPADEIISQDIQSDLLKIVVKDRYGDHKPATAFIKGFGLRSGAFASSVAHDSHNIICVGACDDDIVSAINQVVKMKGGLAVSAGGEIKSLSLPYGGIMSDRPVGETAELYEMLSSVVKSLGCRLSAPFMTLSFMALLVIPELKLSDRGLFDGRAFKPVPLFVD